MEKTTFGLIAALGAVAATPASANMNAVTTDNVLKPASIAELLDPVPNAAEVLKGLSAKEGDTLAPVELAELVLAHHHHHHHRRVVIVHHHHHHHHFHPMHHDQ